MKIVGCLMIVALFAGIFIYFSREVGWKETLLAYSIAFGIVLFVSLATYFVTHGR